MMPPTDPAVSAASSPAPESALPSAQVPAPVSAPAPAAPPAAATGPAWTVLCVDDEPSILSALRRVLRPEGCRVLQAQGGQEALEVLARETVDVVISDMRMPGMDGAQLLTQVHQRWPETTRILLTGYADMDATILAINQGQIYRYIHKPWDEQELRLTVRQAAERVLLQREKIRLQALTAQQNEELKELNATLEERVQQRTEELRRANEQLKHGFMTSIRALVNLMELRESQLGGRGRDVANLSRLMAREMGLPESQVQEVFVAGLLHNIGMIGVPDAIMLKPATKLNTDERAVYQRHPALGAQAMMAIDDLQSVAALIRGHHERYDGTGYPDKKRGQDIPVGARILAVAVAFYDPVEAEISAARLAPDKVRTLIVRGRGSQFDPQAVDAFVRVLERTPALLGKQDALQVKPGVVLDAHKPEEAKPAPRPVQLMALGTISLRPGMVLGRNLYSHHGILLLSAEQRMTDEMIERLRAYERSEGQTLRLYIKHIF